MHQEKNGVSRMRTLIAMGLVLLGVAIGRCLDGPDTTLAQAPVPKSRKAFLSGGARSEKILKDISETLKKIDGRVSNIEAHLTKRRQQ